MPRWVPPPRRSATPLVLALAGTLLAACTDAPHHAPLGPDEPNHSLSPSAPSSSSIDPNDTNYTLEVVLEGSTTFDSPVEIIDPVSGTPTYQWTVNHEPETLLIDVGYDAYGREVQDLRETGTMGDPVLSAVNTTRRTLSVGEQELTRYDRYDNVLPNDPGGGGGGGGGGGECPRCIQPTGGTPVQVTDGVMLDAAAVDALSTLSANAAPLAEAAGPHARVERAGVDRIRITNDLSGGGAPSQSMTGRQTIQPEKGEYVRSYRRSGDKYVLEQAVLNAESRGEGGGSVRMRQVERIQLVRFHENAAKDQQRRAQRAQSGVSAATSQEFDWPVAPAKFCLPDEPPGPNCTPPPPPPPPVDPPSDACGSVTDGANVLFQHGILSGGSTWWRMEPWVNCAFRTNQAERPSINWFWSIESQRDELRGKVPAGMQQIVAIGHSNGGLISRSYAQWAQQHQPGRVRGVVTLDSPNQGAIIAKNAKSLEHTLGSLIFKPLGWSLIDIFIWHPFYEDDVPGSSFLRRTNNFNESFTRVGIRTHTPKRWVAWRIFGTIGLPDYCTPDSNCGERVIAQRAQESYDRARHYSKFWYRPWQSIIAGVQMMLMNGGDAAWNELTAPGPINPSDGFIHAQGQFYPGAHRDRVILNGDSHVGTTRSPYVRDALNEALSQVFGLQVR